MDDCIFCKIVNGEIPSFKVYENQKALAFADINPITTGHTLIIPKNHAENLHEISEADLSEIHKVSRKLAAAMKEVLNPEGIALLQLNGRGVNQLVMHYHLHMIPRTSEAPDLSITAWEMIPGDMDLIEKTAESLRGALD